MIYDYMYSNRFGVDRAPAPRNDPKLLAKVKVKVLRPFGLAGGRVAKVGEIVELPRYDAESLAAIGKVEIVK